MKQPIEALIDACLKPVPPPTEPGDLPYPTHSGILKLGDLELKCHRLNDGQCIIEQESIEKLIRAVWPEDVP
jgi:hypothetical protein